ncbi:MAG: nuclear transport factor 2 family protein [Calditrichia bacterium]
MKKQLIILITLLVALSNGFAQVETSSDLFIALKKMDQQIFDKGFNECDTAATRDAIHEDFEFYHDTGGIDSSKEAFMRTYVQNICGNPEGKPIRELVEKSLQVFPMRSNGTLYGALQRGEHKFYIREANGELRYTTSSKFTHLWILVGENWKLKRVLSYDHS